MPDHSQFNRPAHLRPAGDPDAAPTGYQPDPADVAELEARVAEQEATVNGPEVLRNLTQIRMAQQSGGIHPNVAIRAVEAQERQAAALEEILGVLRAATEALIANTQALGSEVAAVAAALNRSFEAWEDPNASR